MSTKLEFVGHACFRLWHDERPTILMDPFSPDTVGLESELQLEADTVIVSSLTDPAHDNYRMAPGSPRVINALDVARGNTSATINGESLLTVAAGEAPNHTEHSPHDNALYAFKADELWFVHMGDLGYRLTNEELAPFTNRCDVFLVLTGSANTPSFDDLDYMIAYLQPTWIVPMHYELPPIAFGAKTVDEFLDHRAGDPVIYPRHHTVEFPLPSVKLGHPTIVVPEPSGYTPTCEA